MGVGHQEVKVLRRPNWGESMAISQKCYQTSSEDHGLDLDQKCSLTECNQTGEAPTRKPDLMKHEHPLGTSKSSLRATVSGRGGDACVNIRQTPDVALLLISILSSVFLVKNVFAMSWWNSSPASHLCMQRTKL